MASVSTHTAQSDLELGSRLAPAGALVLPELLQCLVVSWSDERALWLQSAAEAESWQAEVCSDVREFLRSLFQLDAPLTVVDLPSREDGSYESLQNLTAHASGLSRSLLMICGASGSVEEEMWARNLGVWAYLPGTNHDQELRHVFAEARKATARQSSRYVEASVYR